MRAFILVCVLERGGIVHIDHMFLFGRDETEMRRNKRLKLADLIEEGYNLHTYYTKEIDASTLAAMKQC